MQIRRLTLAGYMAFTKAVTLQFPSRGIVLVTGANGTGKSTLADAVSSALWGKAIRPTPPWNETGGVVQLETDELSVRRSNTKTKTQLSWRLLEGANEAYDTASKAQEALNPHLPITRELWQRTHVFRSFDLGALSRTSDAERKRLLESMLGISDMDTAHAAAKEQVRATQAQISKLVMMMNNAREQIAHVEVGVQTLIAEAKQDHSTYQNEKWRREEALTAAKEELRRLENTDVARHESMIQQLHQTTANISQVKSELALLDHNVAKCLVCDQPLGDARHDKIATEKTELLEALSKRRDVLSAEVQKQAREQAQIDLTKADLVRKVAARKAALDALQDQTTLFSRTATQLAVAEDLCWKYTVALTETAMALRATAVDLRVWEAVESVYNLRGVRAMLLNDALALLTGEANRWLTLLCQESKPISVLLQSTTQTTAGETRDKINLLVDGVGEGYGYYACSDGEQRRIDLALLFSLSALAGDWSGTLFVDECFDSLHETGVRAAIEALNTIAQERCVVLTTHRVDIARLVTPDAHWHFSGSGVVEQFK